MMISNEERREVAERLRVYSHDFDFSDSDPFWYVSKAAFGDVDVHTHCSVFARLADLIDLPTCRNIYAETEKVGGCENGFKCSECGNMVEDCEGYRISGEFNYCSKCGAVVVSDDD